MSYRLTDWAWSVEGLVTRQRITLLALARHCNSKGGGATCWPSQACLMAETGLSERALRNSLRDLEDRRLISAESGSGKTTSRYRLACQDTPNGRLDLPEPDLERHVVPPSSDLGRHVVPPRAARGAGRAARGAAVKEKEQRIEQRRKNSSPPGVQRESQSKRVVDALCLSQLPQGELIRIAGDERPDIHDPSHVLAKFTAHVNGSKFTPEEWERRWRLWLLNERANWHAQPQAPSGEFGSFLADQHGRDISADYEVIPNAR